METKNVYYHIVLRDGKSERDSVFKPRIDNNILFYAKEYVKCSYSYGNMSEYVVVDANGNECSAEITEGYLLKAFSTTGCARAHILKLYAKTPNGDDMMYQLTTDSSFNYSYYGYEEWNASAIFKSIIDFFREVTKYGYETWQYINSLRRECHDKANSIDMLKREKVVQERQLKQVKNSITEAIVSGQDSVIESFKYSPHLQRVIIPSTIRRIESFAFESCENLSEILCFAVDPPFLGVGVFYKISKSARIYVPQSSIEKYKTNKDWKQYEKLITEFTMF